MQGDTINGAIRKLHAWKIRMVQEQRDGNVAVQIHRSVTAVMQINKAIKMQIKQLKFQRDRTEKQSDVKDTESRLHLKCMCSILVSALLRQNRGTNENDEKVIYWNYSTG